MSATKTPHPSARAPPLPTRRAAASAPARAKVCVLYQEFTTQYLFHCWKWVTFSFGFVFLYSIVTIMQYNHFELLLHENDGESFAFWFNCHVSS